MKLYGYVTFERYEYKADTYIIDIKSGISGADSYNLRTERSKRVYDILVTADNRFIYSKFIETININIEDLKKDVEKLSGELENIETVS